MKKLKCNTLDPIPLGEGAGVGWPKGIDKMQISEDSTLYDLVQAGINNSHAAVGVLVRLRKELSDVKDIPVLIAIDQVRKLSLPHYIFFSVLDLPQGLFFLYANSLASITLIDYCCISTV